MTKPVLHIGINGFGRIGRLLIRQLSDDPKIQVTSVNDPATADPAKAAYRLKYDSIHGTKDVEAHKDGTLTVGDEKFGFTAIKDPTLIPWAGVDVVVDCTPFSKREFLVGHVHGSVKNVVKSSPATADVTVVYGVNHDDIDPTQHQVISNASCTTNCAAPVLKLIDEKYGIASGLLDTVHALTNTDPTVDGAVTDDVIDGRSGVNIKPTSTGAAKAVKLVLPQLADKLAASSTRVPVADGSLLTFSLVLKTPPKDADEVNALLKAASTGAMKGVVGVTNDPLVSSDIIGRTEAAFVQLPETKLIGNLLVVKAWYDNESGYVAQLVRTLKVLAEKGGYGTPDVQGQASAAQEAP
jgi:glyceraldehyde 3-phosphate dehydrogenase